MPLEDQHVFVRTSYDIVTPRKCVTISTSHGGAAGMRVSINSTIVFNRVTGKDL